MKKKLLLWTALLALPLAAAGLAYGRTLANADKPQANAGYICPVTGEELPCPDCCPFKK